jgi:hypothetical protein
MINLIGIRPAWAAPPVKAVALLPLLLALLCDVRAASAQFVQQGQKLVPSDAVEPSKAGWASALSSDGNTMIVGAPGDSSGTGGAWIFVRTGGVWTQQGPRLVGTTNGTVDAGARQGTSVALSADGNTAIIGGPMDNIFINGLPGQGAAWVFTRSNGSWAQQGAKLVGSGGSNTAEQGLSVALSADGNTAAVGGPNDNTGDGAVWVFTRSNGAWSQVGMKLVGSGAINGNPGAEQGTAVALSGDGNTLMVGGPNDNAGDGAVWVFVQSNGSWTQQGNKLATSPVTSNETLGTSLALSTDGNTAIVGATGGSTGEAWVFTRSNGSWAQQGSSLVGSGVTGAVSQGLSISLSGDGNTAILGGLTPNGQDCTVGNGTNAGVAWIFKRNGTTWSQPGSFLIGSNAVTGICVTPGVSVALSSSGKTAVLGWPGDNTNDGAAWVFAEPIGSHDFNGDGYADIAWRDTSGDMAVWLMSGTTILSSGGIAGVPTVWSIVGQRDFNGDGMADLLWRDTSGDTSMWFMNGTVVGSTGNIGNVPGNWSVAGVADFNGDGYGDLLWRDGSGDLAVWLMNGATVLTSAGLGNVSTTWTVVGTGDFNGDGMGDLLWRDNLGNTSIWFMNGTTVASTGSLGNIPTNWSVAGTGDFNGDGKADIVWRDSLGAP